MKRVLTLVVAFGLSLGGAFAAFASPGPNDNNNHGLCTAFFNGQKKGHEKQDEYPGPFQPLLDQAPDGSDEDDEGGSVADLYDWCQQYGIGGNGDENGRFTSCWTDDDDNGNTHNCDD